MHYQLRPTICNLLCLYRFYNKVFCLGLVSIIWIISDNEMIFSIMVGDFGLARWKTGDFVLFRQGYLAHRGELQKLLFREVISAFPVIDEQIQVSF
uniref:Uncharacterized protein n=1 Tax=Rhizophora mucronata TaxID=61149 RepID=A0A2P2JDP6_RHIMU